MKKKIKALVTKAEEFQVEVDWLITQRCNYTCTYCGSYDNSKPFMFKELPEYINSFKYLSDYFGNKTIKLSLVGGEPMLYKQWPELINWLSSYNYVPKITTNLSTPVKNYIKKIDKHLEKFIIASWHPEFATEKFMENIAILHDKNFIRSVSVSAPLNYWNAAVTVIGKLKELYGEHFVHLQRITNQHTQGAEVTDKEVDYTPEQMKHFTYHRDFTVKTIITELDGTIQTLYEVDAHNIDYKGMYCAVGRDRLHIMPNGNVYPSACLLNYNKAIMGNIYKQNIIKPAGAIRCPFVACYCGPDQRIEKWT